MDYGSTDGREAIGKYYNGVLEDLRTRYDEPEAMRRYDDFMRSEGYVSIHSDEYKPKYSNPLFTLNAPLSAGATGPATGQISWSKTYGTEPLPKLSSSSDETYQLRSEMKAVTINGKVEYLAESYGTMHSDRAWTKEAQEAWQGQSRIIDGLDSQAFLDTVPNGERRAIVGASGTLGSTLSAVLADAGIVLGDGESLIMSFPKDQNTGEYLGVRTGRDDIDNLINNNPALSSALRGFWNSSPVSDTSVVPGQYQDGTREVRYSQERQLVFSPDQSDAVVATNLVNITASGYSYIKKVSDTFEPSCDSYMIDTGEHGTAIMMGVGGDGRAHATFVEDLKRALHEKKAVSSTISREDYEDYVQNLSTRLNEYRTSMPSMKYTVT